MANQNIEFADDVDVTIAKTGGLVLGSTAVTSTAAVLNLLDGSAANTLINSKAVVYGAAGQLTGTTITGNSLVGVTLSGSSNISANAFIMAGTNAAGAAKLFKLSVNGGIMLVSEAGTP